MTDDQEIVALLHRWSDGDEAAADLLATQLYDELRRIAQRLFSRERAGHTLQPTALVNEAFARLLKADVDWQDRAHFFALAARMMRRLLINHAEMKRAEKRGGDAMMVTLHDDHGADPNQDMGLLALNDALDDLTKLDPRKAELIEMKYLAGMTTQEMAAVTKLSESTIGRELRFARAWLKDALSTDE